MKKTLSPLAIVVTSMLVLQGCEPSQKEAELAAGEVELTLDDGTATLRLNSDSGMRVWSSKYERYSLGAGTDALVLRGSACGTAKIAAIVGKFEVLEGESSVICGLGAIPKHLRLKENE